ncbi:MAG TPA: MmoB/DmpM family protein [Alphaproteobacteria bacterium]|jgi:phenol hydroxylase P2 protein|nr:MmoB/DmpM family protein [Alphaproteobacteria bacterium]
MSRSVSITLQNTDDARAIVAAILADNPGAAATQFPSMTKIDCQQRLVVKRASVAERLGRDWDPQELQLSLVTLSGNIDEDDDQFVLAWH